MTGASMAILVHAKHWYDVAFMGLGFIVGVAVIELSERALKRWYRHKSIDGED